MALGIWRCMSEEVLNGIFSAADVFSICRRCDNARLLLQDAGKLSARTGGVILRSDLVCERLDRSGVRACSEDDGSESGGWVGEGQV